GPGGGPSRSGWAVHCGGKYRSHPEINVVVGRDGAGSGGARPHPAKATTISPARRPAETHLNIAAALLYVSMREGRRKFHFGRNARPATLRLLRARRRPSRHPAPSRATPRHPYGVA